MLNHMVAWATSYKIIMIIIVIIMTIVIIIFKHLILTKNRAFVLMLSLLALKPAVRTFVPGSKDQ